MPNAPVVEAFPHRWILAVAGDRVFQAGPGSFVAGYHKQSLVNLLAGRLRQRILERPFFQVLWLGERRMLAGLFEAHWVARAVNSLGGQLC